MADHFRPVYEAHGTLNVRLEGAEVEHPPGNKYLHHRLVTGDGRPGVVVAAQRECSLLLVRSWRVSAGQDLWELPRGSSEVADTEDGDDCSSTTLIRAGLRELLEETGYRGADARVIGRYFTDSTVYPQRIGVVHCTVNTSIPSDTADGEIEEQRWFELDHLMRLVREGTVQDAHTLSALALLGARE